MESWICWGCWWKCWVCCSPNSSSHSAWDHSSRWGSCQPSIFGSPRLTSCQGSTGGPSYAQQSSFRMNLSERLGPIASRQTAAQYFGPWKNFIRHWWIQWIEGRIWSHCSTDHHRRPCRRDRRSWGPFRATLGTSWLVDWCPVWSTARYCSYRMVGMLACLLKIWLIIEAR